LGKKWLQLLRTKNAGTGTPPTKQRVNFESLKIPFRGDGGGGEVGQGLPKAGKRLGGEGPVKGREKANEDWLKKKALK